MLDSEFETPLEYLSFAFYVFKDFIMSYFH